MLFEVLLLDHIMALRNASQETGRENSFVLCANHRNFLIITECLAWKKLSRIDSDRGKGSFRA